MASCSGDSKRKKILNLSYLKRLDGCGFVVRGAMDGDFRSARCGKKTALRDTKRLPLGRRDIVRLPQPNSRFSKLVMTAQIFLDLLTHGFVRIEQVSLLVLDECHHAKKRHPYSVIMSDFYKRAAVADRPKIFGTTASPVDTKWENKILSSIE
jgi:hypothetical protein